MTQKRNNERFSPSSLAVTALFAALVFLGIQIFRIPLPAPVGTPFIHFAHIFVMLGVLFLGGPRGAIAGLLGLLIFDVFNGYYHAMVNVAISTLVDCLVAGLVFALLKKWAGENKGRLLAAVIASTLSYIVTHLILDVIIQTLTLMLAGSAAIPAFIAVLASEAALLINSGFTLIFVPIAYFPLRAAIQKTKLNVFD